jgi:hypothetical protein
LRSHTPIGAIDRPEEAARVESPVGSRSPKHVSDKIVVPDLQLTEVSAPENAFAGQTITIQWIGTNSGSVPVSNSAWNDAVYFSADATLDTNDARLATKLISGPLAVGATYSAQMMVTIPQVSAGTYYLIIKGDEGNFVFEGPREENNTNSAAVVVVAPGIDLQVPTVAVPANGLSGQTVPVNWSVTNAGTMPTFASGWADTVYLSRDQVLQPSDPMIGYIRHSGALDGGASYNTGLNVSIPRGLSGQHYIFVHTDLHDEVAENNNQNNLSGPQPLMLEIPPPCDLAVSNIQTPGSATPGEQITIRWTVTNQEANAAGGQWTDAVYVSTDPAWDSNDQLIGRVDHNTALDPGQSYLGELAAPLPAVQLGQYYVIVRTDVRNQVRESDKSNNAATSNGTMTVDVPELQLGVPSNFTLDTNQERYHKVNTPADETLLYTLTTSNQNSSLELFARETTMVSRSAFDFSFGRPGEANQEIVVPNTESDVYYDLARAAYVPGGPAAITIKAESVPFSIRSVTPDRIGDNGQVTITIHGARFQRGATAELMGNGTTLIAANVMVLNPATATAVIIFFLCFAPIPPPS